MCINVCICVCINVCICCVYTNLPVHPPHSFPPLRSVYIIPQNSAQSYKILHDSIQFSDKILRISYNFNPQPPSAARRPAPATTAAPAARPKNGIHNFVFLQNVFCSQNGLPSNRFCAYLVDKKLCPGATFFSIFRHSRCPKTGQK